MEEESIFEVIEHFVGLLKGNMNNKFVIEVCSDLDYTEIVADISYENHTIATITQENGIDEMEIEFFCFKDYAIRFLLDDFVETLLIAKKKLIKMNESTTE